MKRLVRVQSPHFCAGIVLDGDRVIEAAPILRWSLGWQRARLRAYFDRKGWRAAFVQKGKQ